MKEVEKPVERSVLRRTLGREFYILKRKFLWNFSSTKFSKIRDIECQYQVFSHKSMLLRKLKDVDMYLQYNKITNLNLAVKKLNGVVIRPGETFSIWKLVGRPSARKGYKEGMMIHNGKVRTGVGGGLCQLGNLLYWMILHTPLTVSERWRHSYDVFPDSNRTIPFACGATLAYNYIDLQVKNETDKNFKINLWVDDEYLHGVIFCNQKRESTFEVFERNHCIKQQWWGGYTRHNEIWRKVTSSISGETYEELVTKNNAIMMYNPMLDKP